MGPLGHSSDPLHRELQEDLEAVRRSVQAASGAAVSGGGAAGLGAALRPVLVGQCGGKLDAFEWFRTTWQRGGASTGFARWTTSAGRQLRVMVKLPVGHRERFWTHKLGNVAEQNWDDAKATALATPRCLAAGDELGGYDLAWIVIERFEGKPVGHQPSRRRFELLMRAVADFHHAAGVVHSVTPGVREPDWATLVEKAWDRLAADPPEHAARWRSAVDRLRGDLAAIIARWSARPIDTWCHGDVHPSNAFLRRQGDGSERCVLIDLAMVRPGHWTEDAVYLERQHWGHADALCGVRPVEELARARRERGLPVDEGRETIADIRRALMAGTSLAFPQQYEDPAYLAHALAMLERTLDVLEASRG